MDQAQEQGHMRTESSWGAWSGIGAAFIKVFLGLHTGLHGGTVLRILAPLW